jgi:1,4-alpha-glucan branching enzyme
MKSTTVLQAPVRKDLKKIPFVVKGIEAQKVAVTGDFCAWVESGVDMTKGRDGEWRTTLELEPGTYQYRLLVDGEWRNDESAAKRVANPFGSDNCVLEVRTGT